MKKREEHKGRDVDWFIALRAGKRTKLAKGSREEKQEKKKAQDRAFVEYPLRHIKQVFHYKKVKYRGLKTVFSGAPLVK